MIKDLTACKGNMILVGGRPCTGKTRLCLELLNYFQKRGEKALFYSLEHPDNPVSFHRVPDIQEIIDNINETNSLRAVLIDYFQLLNFNRSGLEKSLELLKKTAHEQSVTVYMFFMLNRLFDECSPDLSGFEYENVDVAKYFDVVVYLHEKAETGKLCFLKKR